MQDPREHVLSGVALFQDTVLKSKEYLVGYITQRIGRSDRDEGYIELLEQSLDRTREALDLLLIEVENAEGSRAQAQTN